MSDSNPRSAPPDPPPPDAYREEPDDAAGLRWTGGAPPRAAEPSGQGRGDWPWLRPGEPEEPRSAAVTQGFRRNTLALGFAWALAVFVLLQGLGIAALLALTSDPSDEAERLAALIVTLVVDVVALAVVPLWVLGGPRRGLAALGLRRPSLLTLGWGLVGLGAAYVTLGIYVGIVELIGVEALEPISTIDEDVIYDHVYLVALTGLLAVIVAPLTEEIFYRGFLVGGIAHRWGIPVALVASSVLFAAVHIDVGSLIPFALIGVIFALVYLRSGNLFSAVLAHFLFNVIAFVATVVDRGVG